MISLISDSIKFLTSGDASADRVLNSIFKKNEKKTVVEWAETNRIMTSDVSAYDGRFSYDPNPYLREIANRALADDPANVIAIMKGAQIGVSTGVLENVIGWIIKHSPANALLASADSDLVKEQFQTKIDNMIHQSGLKQYLRPNIIKKGSSKTGDTDTYKEFLGGRLYARSVQNAGKWRQTSFKYGFIDDFEAADRDDNREGSVFNLIMQRFASFGKTKKVFFISTPALKHTSNIEPLYEKGDKRRYMMPCPCCGTYIPFEFQLKKDKEYYGIIWETDEKGFLIKDSVMYRCQECGEKFPEAGNKARMLQQGKWIPTKVSDEEGYYSYHISALYAPTKMDGWEKYVNQFLEATRENDSAKLKTFFNVGLGLTWEEKGRTPQATELMKNKRSYEVGIVPCELSREDGNGEIVMITLAADLNGFLQGYNSDYCDARLDYEVLAHSESGSTYSITHGSIGTFQRGLKPSEDRQMWSYKHGVLGSVWPELDKIIQQRFDTDDGRTMPIIATAIDSGAYTSLVYQYIDTRPSLIFSFKGLPKNKLFRYGSDSLSFQQSKERDDLYLINGNKIKDELAVFMRQIWEPGINQPPNFMNFPMSSGGLYEYKSYFIEFEGEEKKTQTNKDGNIVSYFWDKKHDSKRNHFWDCRVYNLALRDLLVFELLKEQGVKRPNYALFCQYLLGKVA